MELVPCPACGHFNPSDAKDCQECHAPVPDELEVPLSIPLAPIEVEPVDEPEAAPVELILELPAEPPPLVAAPEVLAKVEQLEAEIAQKPSARPLYLQLAQVYANAKRPDLAAGVIERGLALDPTNTYLRHRLAQITGGSPADAPPAAVETPAPPPKAPSPPGPASGPTGAARHEAHPPAVRPPEVPAAAPTAGAGAGKTAAFKPVFRPPPPARRNAKRGLSQKQKLAIGGGVAAVVLAAVLKLWLFPSTRCLVTGDFRASAPVWSPTGRHLAFLMDDGKSTRLGLYDLGAGTFRGVAEIAAWDAGAFSWSPDGTRLAYTASPAGEYQQAVFLFEINGDKSRKVASGSAPAWAADGHTLIMVCTAEPRSFSGDDEPTQEDWGGRYCRVDVDSGAVQRLALAPRYGAGLSALHEEVVFEQPVAVADDGGKAMLEAQGEFDQFVDHVAAGKASNVAQGSRDLSRELEAKAYTERRKAAMTAERLPYAADIHVAGLGGGQDKALTSDGQAAFPSWTTDGTRILFATNGSAGLEFCTMNPDGSGRQTILRGVRGVDPLTVTLSRDGRQVFFAAAVEGDPALAKIMTGELPADLHVAPAGSDRAVRLANRHPFKQRYAVSPDGKRIVYEVNQDVKMLSGAARSELWVMRF